MQWKRPTLAAMLGLFAVITISGCGRGTMVVVNGDKISKDDFYRRVERSSINELVQASRGQNIQAGAVVLSRMIDERLWEQIARDMKVEPTDKQIDDRISQLKKQGLKPSALAAAGLTTDDLKAMVRMDLALYNAVTKGIVVPPAKVRAYYDSNKDKQFTQPDRVHVAGIVCNDKPSVDQALAKVKSGADFGTVALSMSKDDFSRPRKGEMGWVFHNMKGVPPVVIDEAFRLTQDGVVSEPFYVKDSKQWVLIKRLGYQPKKVAAFNEVRDQILQALMMEGAQKAEGGKHIQMMLSQKRENSKIVIKADRYKAIATAYKPKKAPGAKP